MDNYKVLVTKKGKEFRTIYVSTDPKKTEDAVFLKELENIIRTETKSLKAGFRQVKSADYRKFAIGQVGFTLVPCKASEARAYAKENITPFKDELDKAKAKFSIIKL